MTSRSLAHFALLLGMVACNPASSDEDVADTAPPMGTSDGAALSADQDHGTASAVPAGEPAPDALSLTPDGWGPLRIGMSRADVIAAAGADARPDAVGGPDPEQCDEFRPRNAPDGILVMIERGVLTRISVMRDSTISSPTGVRIGDRGTDVEAAYGARAQVSPHKYAAAPARYVTTWRAPEPGAAMRGIRYEINTDGKVSFLRAGGPSIEYVEGCG